MTFYTTMFRNVALIYGIKIELFQVGNHSTSPLKLTIHFRLIKVSSTLYKQFQNSIKMHIFSTLLLTILVAITLERCKGRFLLVEVDDDVKGITGKFYLFFLKSINFMCLINFINVNIIFTVYTLIYQNKLKSLPEVGIGQQQRNAKHAVQERAIVITATIVDGVGHVYPVAFQLHNVNTAQMAAEEEKANVTNVVKNEPTYSSSNVN